MSKIDIRCGTDEEIDEIILADVGEIRSIKKDFGSAVFDIPEEDFTIQIESKEHALNMIKGLEKALELGWFDK